jgi:thiol-disulfide isomerase/thioredoxin
MTTGTTMKRIFKIVLTVFILAAVDLPAAYENEEPVDFSLQQLHGGKVMLSEYRKKWVVLNYWATWCAPCRKEIPDLSSLNVTRDDIVVLGLAFEDTEIENFDEFLDEFNPSYQVLLVDVYAPPEPFGAPRVLPTTIILDPEGRPVKTYLGPVTRQDIESFIDAK